MDCSSFAVDVAAAFDQIFNVGAVYGAGVFFAGLVVGFIGFAVIRGRDE